MKSSATSGSSGSSGSASTPASILIFGALSIGFSLTSHGAEPTIGPPPLSDEATYALTAIDGVPSAAILETLIPDPVVTLLAVAGGEQGKPVDAPTELRLRAIRALSLFPATPETRTRLRLLLTSNLAGATGANILLAQAALESLGRITSPTDNVEVVAVSDSLSHASRDIRVAAARALRQIGSSQYALDALRARERSEEVDAVKYAIYEAIQAMSAPP
jgi:HEAT repeat protein